MTPPAGSHIDLERWSCPLPLSDYPAIVMGHGGGGTLSADLVDHLFRPAFANAALDTLSDSAVLARPGGRVAVSTDSFVVKPHLFPGGSIGSLAVNGTVNDLAMSGAIPRYLTAGFILEEGFSVATLAAIVGDMAAAARAAGVIVVTGDTKVVERGHGDGIYINTAGLGDVPPGVQIAPQRAAPRDVILVSGPVGDHGMAIMSVREGLEFDSAIESDCAPLNGLVQSMLAVAPDLHVLRDPTRGGLASALNEIARQAGVGMVIEEDAVPVRPAVRSACELLGLDPFFVANEGKLVAIVPPSQADACLAAMRAHPLGTASARIGLVTDRHPAMVVARTGLGANRVVTMQIGEQLPRIC
ncbi:MAG: hydrogenase expression/formation protein HypE [Gemmatimonadetes bacterium]|nr:hydrogenase expression/formation protein HypE [Gemmatimonadota bacterium]